MGTERAALETLKGIAVELRQLVTQLRPTASGDARWRKAARRRCDELSERLASVTEGVVERGRSLQGTLSDLRVSLGRQAATLSGRWNSERVAAERHRLTQGYEALVAYLRRSEVWKATDEGALRPVRTPQLGRSVFHVASGVLSAIGYALFIPVPVARWLTTILSAIVVTLEVSRRFSPSLNRWMVERLFRHISRPNELHQTNSASYYVFALTVMAWFAHPLAACLGLLTLAVGDPAAAFVGTRWGRIKLVGDKSLAGALGFVAAAGLVCLVFLRLLAPGMGWGGALAFAGGAALVGAAVELYSGRIDDNFSIPVVVALSATLFF